MKIRFLKIKLFKAMTNYQKQIIKNQVNFK